MHDALRSYMNDKTGQEISNEEFKFVEAAFTPRIIKKKQFLSHEGSICQYMTFIVKGAMRQYVVDDRGVEHIVRFGIENWWISDRESFNMLTPSKYNIDALEDCEVLITTKEKITNLKDQAPLFLRMAHILDENNYIATQKRLEANISFTAEEKFQQLMETHPEFIRRFPQNMLASYLGLTPETVSRVRKQMLFK